MCIRDSHYAIDIDKAYAKMVDANSSLSFKLADEDYSNFTFLGKWSNHYWSWKNNIIPFSNYVDWFLVAILNQTIFSYLDYKSDMFSWSLGYITILILFFFSFYI